MLANVKTPYYTIENLAFGYGCVSPLGLTKMILLSVMNFGSPLRCVAHISL
jgi:hypothetical protein